MGGCGGGREGGFYTWPMDYQLYFADHVYNHLTHDVTCVVCDSTVWKAQQPRSKTYFASRQSLFKTLRSSSSRHANHPPPPPPPPPPPAHTERTLCCMNNCSCAKRKSHSSLWKICSLLAELRKEKKEKKKEKKSGKKIHTTEPFVFSLSLSLPPPPPFFFLFLSSFSFFSPFFPCFVVFNTKRERGKKQK